MKVLLVRHYVPDAQRSMLEFGEAMDRVMRGKRHQVQSLAAKPIFGRGRATQGGVAKFLGNADKFILFPRVLRREARNADLVHFCGQYQAVYLPSIEDKPNVLTCHDLLGIKLARGAVPSAQMRKSGQMLQSMIESRLPGAGHIVCVSQATLEEISNTIQLKPGQASVILNGMYEEIQRMDLVEANAHLTQLGIDPGTRFLFHIGGNQYYKNRPGVVRIFNAVKQRPGQEDLRLVMVGKPPDETLRTELERSPFQNDIVVKVDVSFDQKVALYTKALALLFPSTAEGFGLPIVEAQSCGCPVITTDRAPMNEVALDSAILIDPDDEEGAAKRIADELPTVTRLVSPGYDNARRFTLARMGEDYLQTYERELNAQGGGRA